MSPCPTKPASGDIWIPCPLRKPWNLFIYFFIGWPQPTFSILLTLSTNCPLTPCRRPAPLSFWFPKVEDVVLICLYMSVCLFVCTCEAMFWGRGRKKEELFLCADRKTKISSIKIGFSSTVYQAGISTDSLRLFIWRQDIGHWREEIDTQYLMTRNTLQCGYAELYSQLRWARVKYAYSNDYTSHTTGTCFFLYLAISHFLINSQFFCSLLCLTLSVSILSILWVSLSLISLLKSMILLISVYFYFSVHSF